MNIFNKAINEAKRSLEMNQLLKANGSKGICFFLYKANPLTVAYHISSLTKFSTSSPPSPPRKP